MSKPYALLEGVILLTYMRATFRLENGKIYGIYAHYEAIIQAIRERSVEPIRRAIEEESLDYQLVEGKPCLDYYNCVVVDFKIKIALDIDNSTFGLKKLLPDFRVIKINLLRVLEGYVNLLFEGQVYPPFLVPKVRLWTKIEW